MPQPVNRTVGVNTDVAFPMPCDRLEIAYGDRDRGHMQIRMEDDGTIYVNYSDYPSHGIHARHLPFTELLAAVKALVAAPQVVGGQVTVSRDDLSMICDLAENEIEDAAACAAPNQQFLSRKWAERLSRLRGVLQRGQ